MHISRSLNARIQGSSFHLDCFLQSRTPLREGRHTRLTVTDGHRDLILPLEAMTVILLPLTYQLYQLRHGLNYDPSILE